jgi:hypothetical protein
MVKQNNSFHQEVVVVVQAQQINGCWILASSLILILLLHIEHLFLWGVQE